MSLAPGNRLGSYEVTGQLGRGGMGEVYRARDTRLGRDVAIKVLPPSFASNPERIARFEREARTLAALNHPNIAAIHGLEESGDSKALVLELVEGLTLADRIGARPLPINEALAIAKQIADALEAAHDKGVIHRDLKPANIKVRPDGTVKVLDFGLAKAFDAAPVVDASQSPTLTSPAATMAGVVMGTAAYMSPEQAEGLAVDQRSDIWSFGVVLYEMLTGSRLFGGDSVQRVLAKVLERDVDLSRLPPSTPASIRRVLRRCLERDRKRRLHHIADVRVEIDEALAGAGEEITGTAVTSRRATRPAYVTWALGVLALVFAAVAAFAIWRLTSVAPPSVARFEITTPPRAPLDLAGPWSDVAISPDGSRTVYATGDTPAETQLFLRQSGEIDITPIRGSERGRNPFFSPDGQRIGFVDSIENALKQVSVLGGPPTTIATIGLPIGGASWGPDDTIVYGGGALNGLSSISARGGEPKPLTTLVPGGDVLGHNFPNVLPNGKAVLFTMSGATPATSRIAAVSLETGRVTELITGGGQARYVRSGHIVYGVDGTLRAVRFDQDRLTVSGDPVPVVEGVLVKDSGAALFAVANNNSLVYIEAGAGAGAQRELVWVDRRGRETHIAFANGSPAWPRLSPDGTRAAFVAGDAWVVDLSRGTPSRISDVGPVTFVFWHPDGKRLLFAVANNGKMQMYLQSADGTGKAEPLPFTSNVGVAVSPEGWTADGRIVASYTTSQAEFDIGVVSASGDALEPFLSTPSSEDSLTISPDGRWIAYESNRTGQYEVYVERFPEGGDRRAISAPTGGEDPVWSPSGTELFYRRLKDKAMMAVPITNKPAFTSGAATMLFPGNYYETGGRQYDVDRDGQRFLLFKNVVPSGGGPPSRLILVQNFSEELKRLIPTN